MTCPAVYTDLDPLPLIDGSFECCALPADHSPPHRNAFGDEWTEEPDSYRHVVYGVKQPPGPVGGGGLRG